MQCLPGSMLIVLCTIVFLANAAHQPHHRRYNHHHHSRSDKGYPTGPSSGPYPYASGSGALTVPYSAGNASAAQATGTYGGSSSLNLSGNSLTIESTVTSQVLVTVIPLAVEAAGGFSVSSTESPTCGGTVTITEVATTTVTETLSSSEILAGPYTSLNSSSSTILSFNSSIVITANSTSTLFSSYASSQAASVSASGGYSLSGGYSSSSVAPASIVSTTSSVFPLSTASSVSTFVISTLGSSSSEPIPSKSAPTSSSSSLSSNTLTVFSSTTTSAVPSYSPSTTSSASSSSGTMTPNGIKAGIAGYVSITGMSSWNQFTNHIGWYSDYWPNTTNSGAVTGVPMLWGNGHLGGGDAERLDAFKALTEIPQYMMGFYEPDWTPPDSSDIASSPAASLWSSLITPLGAKGTLLGSPSMATQMSETWLEPFQEGSGNPTWDFTSIHTNKNSVEGVKADVEYYLAKYKKPIWVSEFACVDDTNWTPCTDQNEINTFIQEVVEFFQGNESVVAYGYSNGDGLGDVWPIIDSKTGAITPSGQAYIDTIQGYH